MKIKLHFLFGLVLTISFSISLFAQTDGTLNFSFNQPIPTSPSGNKNVIAVWIESNSGTFIKTKMRYWGSGTNDHLPTWVANCSQNITDATTGATRTSTTNPTAFGTKSFTWDGTDASAAPPNGVLVADGTYKIWIESSWQSSLASNTHNTITSYSFTKGASEVHLTPTGDNYFNTITIDWVPATSSIKTVSENPLLVAYPNPTSRILNIEYYKATDIQIINILGSVIYNEKTNNSVSGSKTINLENFANGIYFINVINGDKSTKYKVILDK